MASKSSATAVVGKVTLKRTGRTGRKRTVGQDPKALMRLKRDEHHEEVTGVDSYLDEDFLREEQKKKYRPEDFHVAVKNEHDHDETIHVRVHPVMKAAMEEMVRSGYFPISTPQDIMRVGAMELMRKLYRLRNVEGKQVTNWIAQLETLSRVLFRNEQLLAFEGSLDTLRRTVERFKRQGQVGEKQAVKMILDVRDAAKKLDKDWAKWYVEKIDDEYEELMDRVMKPVKKARRD